MSIQDFNIAADNLKYLKDLANKHKQNVRVGYDENNKVYEVKKEETDFFHSLGSFFLSPIASFVEEEPMTIQACQRQEINNLTKNFDKLFTEYRNSIDTTRDKKNASESFIKIATTFQEALATTGEQKRIPAKTVQLLQKYIEKANEYTNVKRKETEVSLPQAKRRKVEREAVPKGILKKSSHAPGEKKVAFGDIVEGKTGKPKKAHLPRATFDELVKSREEFSYTAVEDALNSELRPLGERVQFSIVNAFHSLASEVARGAQSPDKALKLLPKMAKEKVTAIIEDEAAAGEGIPDAKKRKEIDTTIDTSLNNEATKSVLLAFFQQIAPKK